MLLCWDQGSSKFHTEVIISKIVLIPRDVPNRVVDLIDRLDNRVAIHSLELLVKILLLVVDPARDGLIRQVVVTVGTLASIPFQVGDAPPVLLHSKDFIDIDPAIHSGLVDVVPQHVAHVDKVLHHPCHGLEWELADLVQTAAVLRLQLDNIVELSTFHLGWVFVQVLLEARTEVELDLEVCQTILI